MAVRSACGALRQVLHLRPMCSWPIPCLCSAALITLILVVLSWTVSVFVGVLWLNANKSIAIRLRQGNVSIFELYKDMMKKDTLDSYNSQECWWSAEKLETTIIFRDWLPGHVRTAGWRLFVVPLWIPVLFFAGVAGGLCWRYHRFPVGRCQNCGYDLFGCAAKKCPECGLGFGSALVASQL